MRRLIDVLAPLGFVVVVGVFALERVRPGLLPGRTDYYLAAGALLVLAHLLLRWDRIAARLGRRRVKYGANMVVLGLVVLAILGLINYLAAGQTKRWDLTKNRRYSLSDQTRKVLAGLQEDVRILYFQRKAELPGARERLRDYENASPRLKVEYVDPWAQPAAARQHDVTSVPTLVFLRGEKREKAINDSEQDVTNGIVKVTRDGRKTVCFVEGEGERDIDDSGDRGFASARAALARSQYEVKKVPLLREGKVPSDCTVLVVAGPEKDLLAPALDPIRGFVKAGGKLLLLVEPELNGKTPGLVALAREWNAELGPDVVLDVSPVGQLFGTGPLTPLAVNYPYHEITKDFRVSTAFHTARSARAGTGTVEGVFAQNLVETGPQSWAETDLSLKEPIELDEGKDTKGPIPLGVVSTVRAPSPAPTPSPSPAGGEAAEEPKKPEGRVVTFGDADFASNALLGFQGNQDFFLNVVAWLAEDADLISIRAREPEDQRLFLTEHQRRNVNTLALLLLPGAFVVLGVSAWWRRRG